MTHIGVKLREIRNLYVLVVFAPGSRRRILLRRESRRPPPPIEAGAVLQIDRKRVRVTTIATSIERRRDCIEHVTEVFTRSMARRRGRRVETATNVVRMPMWSGGLEPADSSVVAEFLRYHVLVRVFDGDPDAWLEHLRERGGEEGDVRFVRWVRSRLRQDPNLLASIRKMVDATPFWRVAEA